MSKEEYIKENNELFKNFLNITFFKSWYNNSRDKEEKILPNYGSLELDFDYHCNLSCTYCYYNKYGKELFRGNSPNRNSILTNLEKVMKFLKKNKFSPKIEIFSGEFFNLGYWKESLDIIFEYLNKMEFKNRSSLISIPTNLSAIIENNNEEEVYSYIEKFNSIGVILSFSASIDGPYLDDLNRPRKNGKQYNQTFYNKLSEFVNKTQTGNHPMLFSKNSEYIFDNLLWFLEADNLNSAYLLEVRNPQWTGQELRTFHHTNKNSVY